jgi:hypothetical protein
VSERFSVSRFALSRHGRGLCKPADGLEPDEKIWLERLERAHAQAVIDQDVRGMQQTTAAALREIRARKAAKVKAAESAPDKAEDAEYKIPVSSLDDVVSMLTATPPDPISESKLKQALRLARALNRPDFVAIVNRAHENHEFAADLATWASCWEPAKKGTDEPKPIQEVTSAPN